MALDPIILDDLTWGEMVVTIRRRIAAASGGKWTLHAPVDPGITLLELFAWLLEQRVYWMDQVPDSLVRGALSLLGEAPRPTQAAATVMRFSAPEHAQVLPGMLRLRLRKSNPPIIFSTENEITLLPFVKLGEQRDKFSLFINDNDKDRATDLEQGKAIRLFPSDGSAAEVKIVLWLRELLAKPAANQRFSLLFDLRDISGISPQWSPEATANVPPPAKIDWYYSGAGESLIRFDPKEIDDGTGGLRRSGVVSLPIKDDWQPESSGAGKGYQYALWMRIEQANFTAPPRLERLIPNVVIATHKRKTGEHKLRREWLPLPGNTISLADLPEKEAVKDHPVIENTVRLKIKERDSKWHLWKMTSDLTFHGPRDRVFTVDRQRGELRFGDGLTGRLPVLANNGGDQLKVQYCVGGGSAGRLGANREWECKNALAVNVVQAEGGDEPELISSARERIASALKQRTRAVIRDDYEEIARTTPGVAIKRARAAIGFHPDHPCSPVPGAVTVFIVPDAPRPDVLSEDSEEFDGAVVESAFVAAPLPDPGALAAVRARMNETRLIASEVFVLPLRYRPIALTVEAETDIDGNARLSQKIKQRLCVFFDPLIGGDTGKGWPFGEPMRPSAILREAQSALGDQGTIARVIISLLDVQPVTASDCDDIAIGAHELVEMRQITVNFQSASDGQGGLR